MITLDTFAVDHHARATAVAVAGRQFHFFLPAQIEDFIPEEGDTAAFPLWAKIWPASLVLADWLATRPVASGCRILEIGAGLGVVSVVGATFGHTITCSEHDPQALAFLRANAQANRCPDLPVIDLDWNRRLPVDGFDVILGSEVTYRQADFPCLERLFNTLLHPGGTIVLASEIRKTSLAFLDRINPSYTIKAGQKVLRSEDQQIKVMLCQLQKRLEAEG